MYSLDAIDAVSGFLPGSLIATEPLRMAEPSQSVAELWDWMQPSALDITAVLLQLDGPLRFASRNPEWAGSTTPVADVAVPVPADAVLTSTAPLIEVLERLNVLPFCVFGESPTAIATTADLGKPAASLWAFGLLLSFEDALLQLVPSVSDNLWRTSLRAKRQLDLEQTIAERRKKGTFITEGHCLHLTDKCNLGREYIADELNISKREWDRRVGSIDEIRNDLAHGRPLGTSLRDGPAGALRRLLALRGLAEDLWRLVEDRPQIWEAYQNTQIELEGDPPGPVFWMLSGQNPWDVQQPENVNLARHEALCDQVRKGALFAGEGYGRSAAGEGAWAERMAVMVGGSDEIACDLSRRFGQRSVFRIEDGTLHVIEVATGAVRGTRRLSPA